MTLGEAWTGAVCLEGLGQRLVWVRRRQSLLNDFPWALCLWLEQLLTVVVPGFVA